MTKRHIPKGVGGVSLPKLRANRKKKKKEQGYEEFTVRDWFSPRLPAHPDDDRTDDAVFALIDFLRQNAAPAAVGMELNGASELFTEPSSRSSPSRDDDISCVTASIPQERK